MEISGIVSPMHLKITRLFLVVLMATDVCIITAPNGIKFGSVVDGTISFPISCLIHKGIITGFTYYTHKNKK